MIANKYISIKSVIDDVFRDTQLELTVSFEDLVYWVYEALTLIDQPLQFVRKVTGHEENPDLDVTDYRAKLPCDFYKLERIAYNGRAIRYSSDTFHHLMGGECCDATGASSTEVFVDNFGNQFSPQSSSALGSPQSEVTFDINNNYITLSERTGRLCIAYLAFPTDNEGYPMIPDDIAYKVACKKYLIQKMRYLDWSKEPSNSGKRALFEYDETEWLWYVAKAINKAKMPHPEQMESLKNQLLRMTPDVNAHANFMKTLGSPYRRKIS